MGMTNAETLVILMNAASRWGKFIHHSNPQKQLLGIINYCRIKYPEKGNKEEKELALKVFSMDEFTKTELEIEWVVPELIHKKGVLVLVGPSGVGKTQLSLRFAEKIIKKESYLKWPATKENNKILFVSMEMAHEELRFFTDIMELNNNSKVSSNLLVLPVGGSIKITSRKGQLDLAEVIEKYQPTGVILDSLGKGVSDDITSEKIIFRTFDYIDNLRQTFNLFTWFVHHPRKSQVGNKKADTQDDVFGSGYIVNNASTVLGMFPSISDIEIKCFKLRMAPKFKPFKIRRTPNMDFRLLTESSVNRNKPILGIDTDDLQDLI